MRYESIACLLLVRANTSCTKEKMPKLLKCGHFFTIWPHRSIYITKLVISIRLNDLRRQY